MLDMWLLDVVAIQSLSESSVSMAESFSTELLR